MSPIEKFRTHVYGTDMSHACEEADVVKMIIEMLLGSTNDIFGQVQKPLDKVIVPDAVPSSGNVQILVFHITTYGLNTFVDKLSSSVLQGILKWFGQFGSHMYLCRKFALNTHTLPNHSNQRNELTSAVLDTLRASVNDLLSAVEEALCDFEQKVLDLPLSDRQAQHHSAVESSPRITLIALYQRCLPWQALFQSLAGLVCSAMPVSATASPHALPLTSSNSATNTADATSKTATDTDTAIDTVFEKLVVRGVLQEVGEMLRLGGLVDIHPSMRLLSGGINSSRNKSGYTAFDIPVDASGITSKSSLFVAGASTTTDTTSTAATAAEVSLTFSLTSLHRSGYYLYAKLLYSAMLEKYLTNLVSMVWASNNSSLTSIAHNAASNTSSGGSVYSHSTSYHTPIKTNPSTPNNNKTHLTPGGINDNTHQVNKTHLDVRAIDSVLLVLSGSGGEGSSGSNGNRYSANTSNIGSTLVLRQKQRRVVSLLHHARLLAALSEHYEVPDFLLPITQEAILSARDVLILQKSHVQRQSPSYNLSSLKALIRDSVLEYRRALLPHHHTNTTTTSTTTTDTTTATTNTSVAVSTTNIASEIGTGTACISRADAQDPVVSYLLTGQSVKIVGVRTAPLCSEKRSSAGGSASSNKENRIANITAINKSSNAASSTFINSLTLASYNGGGVTTNAEYLSVLLQDSSGLISSASLKSGTASVAGGYGSSVGAEADNNVRDGAEFGRNADAKQALIDKVSRIAQHRTSTRHLHTLPCSLTLPTSELLHYTTASTKLHVSLLHRLSAQLHAARADSAKYLVCTHALPLHLAYLRDVFFLGVPDFYAPIRELCLNLTEWKSTVRGGKGSSGGSGKTYRNSTIFIGEAISGTMLEKAPAEGIRHLSVVVNSGGGGGSGSGSGGGSSVGVVSLEQQLTAFLTSMSTASINTATPANTTTTTITATTTSATTSTTDCDVTDLFSIITSMHIDILHQYPLTQFLAPALLVSLNRNMRFLVLLTASRWTAEYWWMDAISNHSLNTTSYTAGASAAAGAASAPASPTKLNSPLGHGAIYGTAEGTSSTYVNPMRSTTHTHNYNSNTIPVTPTKPNTSAADSAHYLADVLQAKRNCRAGLAIWLHTITAINNVFMAHIHRTLWPAFECSFAAHSASLLHMQSDFHSVLSECDASLWLLREHVLSIITKGFSATTSMRAAVVLEYSEIAVVEAQSKQLAAIHSKIHKLSPHKNSTSTTTNITADKAKKVSRNPRVEMRNVPKVSNNDPSASTRMYYKTSAVVLIAYRAAENAFDELKLAVGELKYTVEKEVRRSSSRGSVGREVRAMEELMMYLSA